MEGESVHSPSAKAEGDVLGGSGGKGCRGSINRRMDVASYFECSGNVNREIGIWIRCRYILLSSRVSEVGVVGEV